MQMFKQGDYCILSDINIDTCEVKKVGKHTFWTTRVMVFKDSGLKGFEFSKKNRVKFCTWNGIKVGL